VIFGELGVRCRAFNVELKGTLLHWRIVTHMPKILYQLQKLPAVLEVGLLTIMEYITGWRCAREEISSLAVLHSPLQPLHGWYL